jgi:serine/threonine-protein kinase HipA
MTAKELKLMVFAHLDQAWAPCGQLLLTEEGTNVLASSFAYGLNYARRADALEVDPVSLSLRDREQILGKRLLPAHGLPLFGGIRDAAPDAWGRRVIEAKLKVPANSLPESQYLLHAGSDRVGALDIRQAIHDEPTQGAGGTHALEYLMEAAERIEDGLPIPASLEASLSTERPSVVHAPRLRCATSMACCGWPSSPAARTASISLPSNAPRCEWPPKRDCASRP